MTDNEFLALCLQYSTELICLHNVNGQYVHVSPNAKEIVGYTSLELIGKNPYDFFHNDDKEYIETISHKPAITEVEINHTTVQYRFKHKNGDYIWLKTTTFPLKGSAGIVENLLTLSINCSEEKNKLDSILKEITLLEEAGETAKIGAWEVDLATMQPVWSKGTYKIHGLEEGFMPAMEDALSFYPINVRPEIEKAIQNAITTGQGWDYVQPFITAKNKQIWVRVIGRTELKLGKTTRLYGVFQDVTADVEARRQQLMLIDQLTQKKQQLQEFNQIVSHNLRSPVSSLNALLHFYETAQTTQDKEEVFDKLKETTEALNTLLEELVDAVKIITNEDLEFEKNDIKNVIEQTTKLLKGNVQQLGTKINIDCSAWQEIVFPKLYLDSVLLNLMSNALKYHNPNVAPQINISTAIENNQKVLFFQDNGLGINLERYGEKVFKMHQTFHRQLPGKGLGLFMTKNQLEATGSKISVESEVGKGATFKISFNSKY